MGLDGVEPSFGLYKSPVLADERKAPTYKHTCLKTCLKNQLINLSQQKDKPNPKSCLQRIKKFTFKIRLYQIHYNLARLAISDSTSRTSLPYLILLISFISSANLESLFFIFCTISADNFIENWGTGSF